MKEIAKQQRFFSLNESQHFPPHRRLPLSKLINISDVNMVMATIAASLMDNHRKQFVCEVRVLCVSLQEAKQSISKKDQSRMMYLEHLFLLMYWQMCLSTESGLSQYCMCLLQTLKPATSFHCSCCIFFYHNFFLPPNFPNTCLASSVNFQLL